MARVGSETHFAELHEKSVTPMIRIGHHIVAVNRLLNRLLNAFKIKSYNLFCVDKYGVARLG